MPKYILFNNNELYVFSGSVVMVLCYFGAVFLLLLSNARFFLLYKQLNSSGFFIRVLVGGDLV